MTIPAARRPTPPPEFDYLLVGGGLQNALVALTVLRRRPGARVALVESTRTLGGNHRWSFHGADVPASSRDVVAPLSDVTWPAYEVRFPGFARRLASSYFSFDSARLHDVVVRAVHDAPGSRVFTGSGAVSVGGREVVLENGLVVRAPLVVDARGPSHFVAPHAPAIAGYQKFVGLEVDLARPSEIHVPCVMDATVAQQDGFRFVYLLPLSTTRLLVEDTYFSEESALDRAAVRDGILDYCQRRGLEVTHVVREEDGVLPLPARCSAPPRCESPLLAGYMGGWFHPTTGYSFSTAIRLAELIAALDTRDLGTAANRRAFAALVRAHRVQTRFATALNRMLFAWFAPPDRWHVLARFYRLPEDSIRRFYALTTRWTDRARIVCGRPPRGLSPARMLAGRRFA
jgi:lycopene beta-cyclase